MAESTLYGGIEGGGTKFVCAVATSPERILECATFPTADPTTTFGDCVRFFASAQLSHGRIGAFGFGCFGPIELRRDRPNFGQMMATPKMGLVDH